MDQCELLPFLKWAGGKRWLASNYTEYLPTQFGQYIEPFLGSGAVYFRLKPSRAILSDINKDLVETYQALTDNYRLVRRYLMSHQREHSSDYYYTVRSIVPKSRFSRAARFIYLNRTCWNALYRVNLNGIFNVPKGTKDSVLLDSDNFRQTSKQLQSAKLICGDFEGVINAATDEDFIFADPPYTVKHNLNGFVKYNEKIFGWKDQVRLRNALVRAAKRGAKILLTNADHESIRALYSNGFYVSSALRQSVIAACSERRSRTSELLISNFA